MTVSIWELTLRRQSNSIDMEDDSIDIVDNSIEREDDSVDMVDFSIDTADDSIEL